MKTALKIAIYSGTIPGSSFIEHLINGVAETHQILLFGSVKQKVNYNNKRITVIETPTNQLLNVPLTCLRILQLGMTNPKLLIVAFKEARQYKSHYEQWMRFSRFVPVLLYKPDIFHIQWAGKLNRWVFLKEAYGCHLILSLRGTQINISPKVRPELAKSYVDYFPEVSSFHAVCETIKEETLKYGVSPNKIQTIYTLLQAETFDYFSLVKPISKQAISIVSVGRYHWVKGYIYALKTIKKLMDHGIDVNYTIIAPGLPPEDLVFAMHQLGLQDRIHFQKPMNQQNLFKFMKSFDVFLLPSLSEGIANVVLEAMAIGLPVVSTDCGGMPEVIKQGETGWIVPIRNPEAMAHAIESIMEMPQEVLHNITTNAHIFVKTHFQAADSINQFLELYENICHSERSQEVENLA